MCPKVVISISLSTYYVMALLILLVVLVSSATATDTSRNQAMTTAIEEMQRANYFTFVMLIKMAPSDLVNGNITFLMPNDRILAKTGMPENRVVDFLLHHSIPSPLLMEHLLHFPTGSLIPTSMPGFVLKISNDGRSRFFLNNVRIISPNICTRGSSIRCHGIDGVVQATSIMPQPNVVPPSCPSNGTRGGTPVAAAPSPPSPEPLAPVTIPVRTPPPADSNGSPQNSNSPRMCNAGLFDLVTTFFMVVLFI
ncbi:FAS1 domain-containing protein SELMODRAFT_448915-like [Olea europaea var. sylvestris]|uniref:FAS1 domain-containing protein SELMODRAFT_448915-like n=1 Tax=Olea europaea var. sylvestris TaxID=158386 RepID=UPI000C1D4AC1|nr:FAS1 domain-containing protein SELMODRAFT_448915-like [Olea europaea var. sylvestris]